LPVMLCFVVICNGVFKLLFINKLETFRKPSIWCGSSVFFSRRLVLYMLKVRQLFLKGS
jgi:hypothetical protein